MRSSTASLLFGAALALSLAGKALGEAKAVPPDEALFVRTAAAAMRAGGLSVATGAEPLGPAVYGRRGGCRLMIVEAKEGATFTEAYREMAAGIGPVVYLYRGRWSADVPGTSALAGTYFRRALQKVGIPTPRSPVAAAAATPGCRFPEVAWARLKSLPR